MARLGGSVRHGDKNIYDAEGWEIDKLATEEATGQARTRAEAANESERSRTPQTPRSPRIPVAQPGQVSSQERGKLLGKA